MDTLRGLNYVRKAKNSLFNFTDEAGKLQIAPIVRIYMYCVCGLLILLGLFALIEQHWFVGIASIVCPFIIILLELAWLVPSVEIAMRFFYENYLWRAIVYLILAIPSFFTFETILGAVLVVIGAVAYGLCFVKGEEPQLADDTQSNNTETLPPPGSSWFSDSEN